MYNIRVMDRDLLAQYDVVLTTYSIVQGEYSSRFRSFSLSCLFSLSPSLFLSLPLPPSPSPSLSLSLSLALTLALALLLSRFLALSLSRPFAPSLSLAALFLPSLSLSHSLCPFFSALWDRRSLLQTLSSFLYSSFSCLLGACSLRHSHCLLLPFSPSLLLSPQSESSLTRFAAIIVLQVIKHVIIIAILRIITAAAGTPRLRASIAYHSAAYNNTSYNNTILQYCV